MAAQAKENYILHIGNKNYSSWSMRPWVLMKALHIPFTESLHIFKSGYRQPHFIEFSPRSQVPCLHDFTASPDKKDPIIVWDSLAILHHLAFSHPEIWPSDPAARAYALSAASEMHSSFSTLRNECSMNCGIRIALGPDEPSEDLSQELDRLNKLWTEGLQKFGGPWLAGREFTGVDAFYAPVAVRIRTYGLSLQSTKAMEYAEQLLDHEAIKEWVDAGVAETATEPYHEKECLMPGRQMLEDLRKKD